MEKKLKYDFSGWATRNDLVCSDGRTIRRDAFAHCDGKTVPLVWNHQHDDPTNILGHALLENREDGVYAYCTFNETAAGKAAKLIVQHGDVDSLSIYANGLKQQGGNVMHGDIKELSLVVAGANPGAFIDFVDLAHGEGAEQEVIFCANEPITLAHADEGKADDSADDGKKSADGDKKDTGDGNTVEDVINSLTEKQKTVVVALLANAILIGDGRDEADEHKISEEHVRSIWNDDDLYTIHYDVDIEAARNELQGTGTASRFGENYIYAEAIITAALYSREKFKGTGTPDFFCTPHLVNVMLLARDTNGRRIYNSKADLAAALNINELHTAEQFEGLARTDKTGKKHNLLGIFVNLSDYTVGSTKGGEITRFNQFDIDFNQEKYLIETRLSGALTRLWSAIALEEPVKASSGQTEDTGHDGT